MGDRSPRNIARARVLKASAPSRVLEPELMEERMIVMKKRSLSMALLGVFFAFQVLAFPQPSHAMASGCFPSPHPVSAVSVFRIIVVGYEYAKGEISMEEAFFKIFPPEPIF